MLKEELKELLVEALNLEDVDPADIKDDEPLFGAGLDLDSIDALELVLQLERQYGIKIGNSEESKKALASIDVLADYIERQQAAKVSGAG
ncbi:MAG: acyl carrier protein [Opitutales bacterium]|nr:acyl carrier protein [Opitutales bacterium]